MFNHRVTYRLKHVSPDTDIAVFNPYGINYNFF